MINNKQMVLTRQFKSNFWFSFLQSLLLVFISEFCESNFIQILVNNLKTKSEVVFSSTLISLLLIHSISFVIGFCFSFMLLEKTVEAISLFLLFLTGIAVIIKALIKKSKSIEEEMIGKLKEQIQETIDQELSQQQERNKKPKKIFSKELTIIDECQTEETNRNDSLCEPLLQGYNSKLHKRLNGIERDEYEKKFYSRKRSKEWSYHEIMEIILTVIRNEIGKPTQMAIIIIAAAGNINGLIFGASISLFLVTVLACCFGETISKYVTSRTIMFITGFSFIVLGIEVIYEK